MHHLAPDSLAAMARAQVWAVVPLGNAARLGFDQWRGVLLASCVAEALVREVGYPYPDAARLRTLLASSGVQVPGDELMAELSAFRGVAAGTAGRRASVVARVCSRRIARTSQFRRSGARCRVAVWSGWVRRSIAYSTAAERRCAALIERRRRR